MEGKEGRDGSPEGAEGRGREEGGEPRHPIGVVAQRTGLSAHALRAWERRYGVVEPARSEGGHRLYSDADVEHLRLLHQLTRGGRQIGQIVGLSTEELRELLEEDRRAEARAPGPEAPAGVGAEELDGFLTGAYAAVEGLDSDRLDSILRRAALTLSTPSFLDDFVLPLLGRIGQGWEDHELRPAHEHLASAVTARVAGWLMDAFEAAGEAPLLVVGTPAGQRHELGALSAAVAAASAGWRVRYLGPDLPADDVALVVRQTGARAVALSIVYPFRDSEVEAQLRRLRAELPDGLPLLVGGAAAESYAGALEDVEAVRLNGFRSLRSVLEQLEREGGVGAGGRR